MVLEIRLSHSHFNNQRMIQMFTPCNRFPRLSLLVACSLLVSCGSTVTTKQMGRGEMCREWSKDPQWEKQYATALTQLQTTGMRSEWEKDREATLAKLRAESMKKSELRPTVAILAAEAAADLESGSSAKDARGLWLTAAEGAWYSVKDSPKEVLLADDAAPARFMVDLYNRAVSRFVDLDFSKGGLRTGKPEGISVPGGTMHVALNSINPGALNPDVFDALVPTDCLKIDGFDTKGRLPGAGATFAGVIHRKAENERDMAFTPKRGLNVPVTATLRFPPTSSLLSSRADVILIDSTTRREIPLEARPIPVSRDCTSPLALEFDGISDRSLGLGGFLRVENRMTFAGLYMLQPYDPNRIPVLMIHGLQSSPVIWRNLVAELQADPKISARYQFWVFYYPSGMAIPFSRQLIVEKLEAVRRHFDPQGHDLASHNMVVIGHSMGGVLSRSLITDVGDRFWKEFSEKDFSEMRLSDANRRKVRDLVFFKPLPQVKRAIFICAPHRGAAMAEGWIGKLGGSLVRLPSETLKFGTDIFTGNDMIFRAKFRGTIVSNGVFSLRPGSPIFSALNSSPFVKGVPYHSIMGDRGKGDTPDSSDGVVPYSSSHLDGAASELIVPSGHGGYEDPAAVAEIRRILHLHVGSQSDGEIPRRRKVVLAGSTFSGSFRTS